MTNKKGSLKVGTYLVMCFEGHKFIVVTYEHDNTKTFY